MNVIFTAVTVVSAIMLLFTAPADFLTAALSGGKNALLCAVTLFCVYAFWMGLSAVAEEAKLTRGAAKLLAPVCRKLFKTEDGEAVESIAMNISCNLLGIGGAATPYGVRAVARLEKQNNSYAQDLLFIINATSIQLIPTTVIALRASLGSAAAHDVTLPSLIASSVSTLCGALLYVLYNKSAKKRKKTKTKCST